MRPMNVEVSNTGNQPFISAPFSLAQAVPQKHAHSPLTPLSLPQQRFPQSDVIQGGTQLMFPSHYQDGRGSLRFRYLNLLARLFPQFSDIFINSVLEDTNCDLLAAAEWLVQLEDRRSFMYPAFETFGTVPFANQHSENSVELSHQKSAFVESQQTDAKTNLRLSPSNASVYAKFGREFNLACSKGSNEMTSSNQTRLPYNPPACAGTNQTNGNCLLLQSQQNQYKPTNLNRIPNILPYSQVRVNNLLSNKLSFKSFIQLQLTECKWSLLNRCLS